MLEVEVDGFWRGVDVNVRWWKDVVDVSREMFWWFQVRFSGVY